MKQMSVIYTYPPRPVNGDVLNQEIVAAGLPAPRMEPYLDEIGQVIIVYDNPLSAAEKNTLDGVVAAHIPPGPRQTRNFWDILQDYQVVSGANRSKIYQDLTTGDPPKWATDQGPNKAAVAALHFSTVQPGGSPASLDMAKSYFATSFVQDNPTYLVNNPEFPGVNVPGDEPVP
jgi:hypothetical protein